MQIEIIYHASLGEFRVQGDSENTEPASYYTDEICDAVDTARQIFGKDVDVRFSVVEGED